MIAQLKNNHMLNCVGISDIFFLCIQLNHFPFNLAHNLNQFFPTWTTLTLLRFHKQSS
jgi:hypothetical protein